MIDCIYCGKSLLDYKSTKGHISNCKQNSGEFYLDDILGFIHWTELSDLDFVNNNLHLKSKYSSIRSNFKRRHNIELPALRLQKTKDDCIMELTQFYSNYNYSPTSYELRSRRDLPHPNVLIKHFGSVQLAFKECKLPPTSTGVKLYSDEFILKSIIEFVDIEKRIPTYNDFDNNSKLPSAGCLRYRFGSLENIYSILNIKYEKYKGFGKATKALDGVTYRSALEAAFVNKYLYIKYRYYYEIRYPEPYKFIYDFYLPEKNLYLEIAGVNTEEYKDRIAIKQAINLSLNRNLRIISSKDMKRDLNI